MSATPTNPKLSARNALQFVVLLGVVSLFADLTYEGARSINGPFLAVLGASAVVVGVVGGLGELLGYGLRLVSGPLSERTRQFWFLTFAGYTIQMISVPALAYANTWGVAVALILSERIAKAIRTPARDVMLSHASKQMGYGWGFGLHEAMDQIGALLGPLLVAVVLVRRGNDYHQAFAVLAGASARDARCFGVGPLALSASRRVRADRASYRNGERLFEGLLDLHGWSGAGSGGIRRFFSRGLSLPESRHRSGRVDTRFLLDCHGSERRRVASLRPDFRPPRNLRARSGNDSERIGGAACISRTFLGSAGGSGALGPRRRRARIDHSGGRGDNGSG